MLLKKNQIRSSPGIILEFLTIQAFMIEWSLSREVEVGKEGVMFRTSLAEGAVTRYNRTSFLNYNFRKAY